MAQLCGSVVRRELGGWHRGAPMRNDIAVPAVSAVLLLASTVTCFAADELVKQDDPNTHIAQPSQSPPAGPADAAIQPAQPAPQPNPTKLHCRAARADLGMYEPLRIISITVDPGKRYVKMVHEGDGRTFEFTDGATSPQGNKNFVKVTDELIVYGQGRESWKIDRYTGTLTSASIAIPFECQLRPSERKF